MKKIKVLFISILMLILTTACTLGSTPTSAVEKLFASYNNNDEEILVELDDYVNTSNLTEEQNKKYKEVVNTDEYNNYYYGYGYTKEEVIEEYD